MAEHRMFAKTVIDSDDFLDMPLSAQALYFHLAMRADDDGFVNNPKKIQRMISATDDDCKLLIAKRFIVAFESGVIVIRHWKIHNYIKKDRYHETIHQTEKRQLKEDASKAYIQDGSDMVPTCIQDGSNTVPQSIDKYSIDKYGIQAGERPDMPEIVISIPEVDLSADIKRFIPPTLEEVKAYCLERGCDIDAGYFIEYYNRRNWKTAKGPMKDWQRTIRNWDKKQRESHDQQKNFLPDSRPYKLADGMYKRIQQIDSSFPPPDLQEWASIFFDMIETGIKPEDIAGTITATYNDDFWKTKISSPKDLNRSYGKIHMQHAEYIAHIAEDIVQQRERASNE